MLLINIDRYYIDYISNLLDDKLQSLFNHRSIYGCVRTSEASSKKSGECINIPNPITRIVNPYVVPLMVSKSSTDKKVFVGFQPRSKKLKNVIPLRATGFGNDLGSGAPEVNVVEGLKEYMS